LDRISYKNDIYNGFVLVEVPGSLSLHLARLFIDANPCESDCTNKPDGIDPNIEPDPQTSLQKIDGNTIASGYSNGTVLLFLTLAILCKKNFCERNPDISLSFLLRRDPH